jgi:hypothetical protein
MMIANPTCLSREIVRSLLLEVVHRYDGDLLQLSRHLVELAMEKRIIKREMAGKPYLHSEQHHSKYVDERLVFEEIWSLCCQGLLRPGPSPRTRQSLSLDRLVLTSYGERCMQENRILPHDPQGYLADLQRRCGVLDPEVEVLARESLLTFQANCLVASVILIGAASERLVRVLFESYRDAYQNQADRDRLDRGWENRRRRSIAQKFSWLWQQLEIRRRELNNAGRLWDGAEGVVRSTFDVLRIARNEAVHQNRHFERTQTNELLFLFVPYTERIYALINYFQSAGY